MPGALILINGFPGVGKHAVAIELVKLLPNARFFDTRTLVAAASQLYDPAEDAHALLRKNLKHAIFESIAASTPPGARPIYVLTDFLRVHSRPADLAVMEEFAAFARGTGFTLVHVVLSCSLEQHLRNLALSSATPSAGAGSGVMAHLRSKEEGDSGKAEELIRLRMEEELGSVAHLFPDLAEVELNVSAGAGVVAGILAEYVFDILRAEGWLLQLLPAAESEEGAGAGAGAGVVVRTRQVSAATGSAAAREKRRKGLFRL